MSATIATRCGPLSPGQGSHSGSGASTWDRRSLPSAGAGEPRRFARAGVSFTLHASPCRPALIYSMRAGLHLGYSSIARFAT